MTLQDAATIGLLVAALIQAAAAILIARLTSNLAQSTRRYAESADRQVDELRKQVDELVGGRLAAVQPHVHVLRAGVYEPSTTTGWSFMLRVWVANFGSGPALSLRAQLAHDWVAFPPIFSHDLAAGQGTLDSQPVEIDLGRARQVATTITSNDQWPTRFRLRLECRDLAARWWATDVDLRGSPQLNTTWEVAVDDQREQVHTIDAPSIAPEFPAGVNATGL